MSTPARRLALALIAGLCAASLAHAQAPWPAKPVRMIVPLAAGSAVDNAARIVAQKMSQNLGQSIVIDNKPGAAGLMGAGEVAKAAPDGYTIGGFNDSIMTMLPNMNAKMPWDILKDFEPVSLVATVEWGLVVPTDAHEKSAADLIAAAKKAPGQINYSSGGNGSPQHIAMALFASLAGVQMKHVPYKGATQAAMGVAGKEVDTAFQGIATVTSLIKAGKVRLIGVTTPRRMPQYPDVPTVSESGMPGFEFNSWFAIMAPAGTPKDIVHRLSAEVAKALADPEVRDKLNAQGLTPRGTTPEDLGTAMKAQLAKYGALIRQNGITAD
ncbi:Bug family tripartite tricarboxylate transporter substrate binding protein [Ramlibacter alkalitolerans]|uniref:Tripartite tricarboxylate transporter substrate binding protein n=1 Tax=Ramlibacter alkalitolerans TaxID=2039631 RepID=A0ABS1JJ04_9BURK|nr:tripartite tricarboxylate transporter substrate binding protein [Ramlibacter alkalitolerans]MBL0424192.1 tripartite tricarboxylate transporter substrate binding protein [Ramlibacter alkalitolerans]